MPVSPVPGWSTCILVFVMMYETIKVETLGAVTMLTLHRPEALNALNRQLTSEILHAVTEFERSETQRCAVITGNDRAFAAGGDIKEMQAMDFAGMYSGDFASGWDALTRARKPIVAAVAGLALGGGCELAMMCDFIIAADNARFGQPEIKLGVSPGMGGSQRLARAVGKAKAMDMCLTGRLIDAAEAERSGLVSRLVPLKELLPVALQAAELIASSAPIAMVANKEMVNIAFETGLSQGLRFERRLFHALFATADQAEGMSAFIEKRAAEWQGR